MPVTVMHLVARLTHRSGLPQDVCEMTCNVRFPDEPSLLDRAEAVDAFIDFFNVESAGATNDTATYISDAITRDADACMVLGYETTDLSGATPFGSPTASANFTLAVATAAVEMPEEIAAVISYNADLTNVPVSQTNPSPPPATIRPQARRRGRMFVGPLSAAAGAEVANIFRPIAGFMLDLAENFGQLARDIASSTTGELAVWSRSDADLYPVVGGYVDNAWDVQRRRGPDASSRQLFTV